VDVYVDTTTGLANAVKLNVYYATKGAPASSTPNYATANFTFATGDGWNTVDLSAVTYLQDNPVDSGQLWIGIEWAVTATGPYMGIDYEGVPDNDVWIWASGYTNWGNLHDLGLPGVMMYRPTLEEPAE
jgi:hypothetical protein